MLRGNGLDLRSGSTLANTSLSGGLEKQETLGPSGEHGDVQGRHGMSYMTRLASLVVWTMT